MTGTHDESRGTPKHALAQRRSVVVIAIAIGVVVALLVGWLIARGARSGHEAEASRSPSSTVALSSTVSGSSTSTPTTVGVSGAEFRDSVTGVAVTIPASSASAPLSVSLRPTSLPAPVEELSAIGPIVDIEVAGGSLIGPATVTMPITDLSGFDPVTDPAGVPVPNATTMVILHWVDGQWEPLPTTVDRAAKSLTATTTSFSPFLPVQLVGKIVKDLATSFAQQLSGGLYTDVPEPTCTGTDTTAQWEASPANNPVSFCGSQRADGTAFVQVANRRRYAVTVAAPGGTLTARSGDLAAQVSQFTYGKNVAVLAPGETADITFPASAASRVVKTEYDGVAQSLTSLLVAADILAAVAAKMPFSKGLRALELLRTLNLASCLKALGVDVTAAVLSYASTIAKLIVSCFSEVFKTVRFLGVVLASPVILVASVLAFFVSSGSALFDLIIGGANGTLTLKSAGSAAPAPNQTGGGAGSSVWPKGDNDSEPVLYAWFGAELSFPDWVSCGRIYCLVALGDKVEVIRIAGFAELGSVPLSTPDPVSVLTNAGITTEEVALMLKKGAP